MPRTTASPIPAPATSRGHAGADRARRSPTDWGTAQQLPSGRWRAFYRVDGRRISAPQTFETKAAARAWLAGEQADRSRGTWRDPSHGRTLLRDYAADWLSTRPDLAPRTVAKYRDDLHRWIARRVGVSEHSRGTDLGAMAVADITPAVVRSWRAAVVHEARANVAARLSTSPSRQTHPARVWARANGHEVAGSGRLSPSLIDAWHAAGAPVPRPLPATVPANAGQTAAARAYALLRTVLATAVQDDLLTANPCQIKGAGQSRAAERPTATPAEVAELAAAMPRHLGAAVTLAAWSGLRYGELFALARKHTDLGAGTVQVERAVLAVPGEPVTFGATKTARSSRTVHLPAFVIDVLREHLAEHVAGGPDALLFTTATGGIVSNARLSAVFSRARTIVGRPDLHWHDLRHTGATLAYRAGASVPEVQRRLGHTTMRAAQIYAHAADDSDSILAARLDQLYAESATPGRHLRTVS